MSIFTLQIKWQETFFTHQLAVQKLVESTHKSPKKTNIFNLFLSIRLLLTNVNQFQILTFHPQNTYQEPLHMESNLLDHIHEVENIETPEYIFTYLMKFYRYSNMVPLAVEIFFTMLAFRCNPSAKSFDTLIWVCWKNKYGFKIVLLVLVKSQFKNSWVEESKFKILIRALCRIGKGNNAVDLLNLMADSGFDLDGKICSLILYTMCAQKECDAVEIFDVLDKKKELGYSPKRVNLCNVIRFYVINGKGVDALEVLSKLKMTRMVPHIVCHSLVLNGLILEGKYEIAYEVFDEMVVLGLVPDIVTYNLYINGLCKLNKVDEAVRMLSCMEELGCKPEMNTYYTILEALCRRGLLSYAKEVFCKIKLKGFATEFTDI